MNSNSNAVSLIQLIGEIIISLVTLSMSLYMVAFSVGDGYPSMMIGVVLTFWFTRGGSTTALSSMTNQITNALGRVPPATSAAVIEQATESGKPVVVIAKDMGK